MKNRKIKFFSSTILSLPILFLLTLSVAYAQGPTSLDDITSIIQTISDWFRVIVLIIAIIMIVAAGLTWMTAAGNEDKLKKARSMLIWGLIGLAVVLFATVAQTFVLSIVG